MRTVVAVIYFNIRTGVKILHQHDWQSRRVTPMKKEQLRLENHCYHIY